MNEDEEGQDGSTPNKMQFVPDTGDSEDMSRVTGGQKPDMIAYSIRESSDGRVFWNRVGASFKHRDGKGVDLLLDTLPIDGRVTMREYREQQLQAYQDERKATSQSHNQQRSRERER